MTDKRPIRITPKIILVNRDGTLTAEGVRILSRVFGAVGGDDGGDKVAEAKSEAVVASQTAQTAQTIAQTATTDLDAVELELDSIPDLQLFYQNARINP